MQINDSIIYFDREGNAHDALVELPAADAQGRVDLLYINANKKGFLGSSDFHLAIIREAGVQPSAEVADKQHCYADPRQAPAEPAEPMLHEAVKAALLAIPSELKDAFMAPAAAPEPKAE